MSTFFEIAGEIIEVDDTSHSSFQLGVFAAERLEQRRNSAKTESVTRRSASTDTGESRPGLFEHYLRTLWFAGTEPTKRVGRLFNPKSMSFKTTPLQLVLFGADLAADQFENQYEYFSGGNPWQ